MLRRPSWENPTYVGMDRRCAGPERRPRRKPHVCGDGPAGPAGSLWTTRENPTYVGMDRPWTSPRSSAYRKPHVCGDGPVSVPERRRYFSENPTYVGMDRQPGLHTMTPGRKPHVCGDGPIRNRIIQEAQSKTPRMWGWTDFPSGMGEAWHENPTYVGMDRQSATNREKSWRKPHVCGDGPRLTLRFYCNGKKTPRMWGWTG